MNLKCIINKILEVFLGMLNILAGVPLACTCIIFITTMYLMAFILLAAPAFLILDLLLPSISVISLWTDMLIIKVILCLVCSALGWILFKKLKSITPEIYEKISWYVNKSIKFELIKFDR